MIRHNKKLWIIIASVTLAVLLAAVGVFAWYMNLSTDVINTSTLQVQTAEFLEIRVGETGEYSNAVDLSYENLSMIDLTGDGNTLIRPALVQQYDSAVGVSVAEPWLDESAVWDSNPTAGESYIRETLYIRSNKHMAVYLGSGSAVTPNAQTLTGLSASDTANNKSLYGSFSRDCIAGAARVSFVSTGSDPQTIFVWEPNSQYQLSYVANAQQNESNWQMNVTSGTPQTPHYYYTAAKVRTNLEDANIAVIGDAILASITAANPPVGDALDAHIIDLAYNSETGFYEGAVTVCIWIEGCDREARRALAGGVIDVTLCLYGFETVSGGD